MPVIVKIAPKPKGQYQGKFEIIPVASDKFQTKVGQTICEFKIEDITQMSEASPTFEDTKQLQFVVTMNFVDNPDPLVLYPLITIEVNSVKQN
jgi:hypothetical protein